MGRAGRFFFFFFSPLILPFLRKRVSKEAFFLFFIL